MVFQSNEEECGKACVRNVLAYKFKNREYETATIKQDCKDFLSREEALLEKGIQRSSFKLDDITKISKKELPLICQVINGEQRHFVRVKKIRKDSVIVLDPQFGKRNLSHQEWKSVYQGFTRTYEHGAEREKPKNRSLVPFYGRLLYFVLFLCLTAFLCLSLLFSASKEGFFLGVVFFSLFRISLALTNSLGFALRKQFEEKRRLPYLDKTREKKDRERLSLIFQEEIKRYSSIVNSSSVVLSMAFLLFFDNIYSAFLVVVGLLFSFFRFLLWRKKNYVDYFCTKKENEFVRSRKREKREKKSYKEASRKANEYLGENIILILIEIRCLTVLLRMITQKEESFSLPYFLFRLRTASSFSFTGRNLLKSLYSHEKETRLRNSLSFPLRDFLNEKASPLGYNNDNSGGETNGKKADQGLPEQNRD